MSALGEGLSEPDFFEIEIPVPWGHISGKWWGPRDRKPVVALHGWQDNAGSFDLLVPLLPPKLSLLCIDLPGHGFSSHFPHGQFYYIWWDYVLILRRIVKYYQWQTISILGHSLGGAIGFLYAATYPDEVEKLISLDIVCPRVEPSQKIVEQTPFCIERFLKYENLTPADVPCYTYDVMIDIVVDAYKGSISRDKCEVLMRRGMAPTKKANSTYHFARDPRLKISGLATLSKELVKEYAGQITCEYLNIRADNGIEFVYPELYSEVLDIIKHNSRKFEYHEVTGTHHVHLQDPHQVSAIISNFLTSQHHNSISNNVEDLII